MHEASAQGFFGSIRVDDALMLPPIFEGSLAEPPLCDYLSSMSGTPVDRDLREYLEEGRRQRLTEGEKLDRLVDAVNRVTNEQLLLRQSVDSKFELVQHQIAGINSRVGKVEEKVEKSEDVTGSHNIEELQRKLKDEREQKSFIYKTIIGALGSVIVLGLAGAGTVIWYLVTKQHP